MTYAAHDDLGLFAAADLLPALRLPNDLMDLQERAIREGEACRMLDLYAAWRTERADRPWADLRRDGGPLRAWQPTICGPTVEADSTAACQPFILSIDLRCDAHCGARCSCVGDLIYRHLCSCGHIDDPHTSENEAAEDAMDHGWPGWRDLPILASSMPEATNQRSRWLEAATAAYPAGWIEAGGPVRTARGRYTTRHVPGRTPHRGYDMGVYVAEAYLNHVFTPGLYDTTRTDAT